ncbi:MAG TPA: hypothetical protein VGR62_10165 [Candidatus Binatia bacterium]|nr:hypothetical protein [Candidatus Binatia bacterium]
MSSLIVALASVTARGAGGPDGSFASVLMVPVPPDQAISLGSLVLQPGGEVLAGGFVGLGDGDVLLVRVTSSGAFDPSFGTNGIVRTSIGVVDSVGAIVRQPDGRIVASGGTGPNTVTQTAVLLRYDDDGSLDPTFGSGGIVTTMIAGDARSMVLQPDGALVIVAGNVIARFLGNGTTDPAFGTGGIVNAGHAVREIVRQPDGALVVAGHSGNDLRLLRLLTDGTPDPTFGTGGSATIALTGVVSASALRQQPDGRLLVGGSVGTPAGLLLARVLEDGTLDATFGSGGLAASGAGSIADLDLDPDGNIIAVGSVSQPFRALFQRYSTAGVRDVTFPTPGTFNGNGRGIGAVRIQPDVRIVTAGIFVETVSSSPVGPVAIRGSGTLDRFHGVGVCGNGTVDPGEQCDETGTPCCRTNCRFAFSSTPCASDGNPCTQDVCNGATCEHTPFSDLFTTCDDASLCTTFDHCVAGVCEGYPLDPWPCRRCVPETGAHVAAPRTGCKQTTQPGRSLLKVKDVLASSADRLTWKWTRGEATTIAELGDPINTSPVDGHDALCVFDESGPEPALLVGSIAAAGDTNCSKPPCWKRSGNRLTFKSAQPSYYGLTGMVLTAGTAGKSSMRVTGKGERIFAMNPMMPPPPPPPLPLPLRVQLGATDGACWEATFSASGVRKNAAGTFVGASD